MAQIIKKLCCVCGEDVANQKRTKDSAGNYYCVPCFAQAQSQEAQPATDAEDPLEALAAAMGTGEQQTYPIAVPDRKT